MTMLRRWFLGLLACALLVSAGLAPAKPLGMQTSRVAGADAFPNITAPSGAAGFTATWEAEPGAEGYLVYISTSSQQYPDTTLYTYRYKATGQATASLAISGVASGTYYYRIAAYVGSVVMDPSHEVQVSAS